MISTPDLVFEKNLWVTCSHVAGLDEAGRGALAGPVCVGAVVLPHDDPGLEMSLEGVRDSKQLTPRQRNELVPHIKIHAREWGIGFATSAEIDLLGIVNATRLAACRALESLTRLPDYLLTDFRLDLPELDVPQTSLVKGDRRSLSIAAASILAKTARDARMMDLDLKYPRYGFSRHKGYGTATHRKQITRFGQIPDHRRTFHIKADGT